jgi:tetratricopeptide (TPR) repeat protein
MAAEHNNSYAMYILGNIYFGQNKLDLAEQYYIMAAEHNNTVAMRSLGIIYMRQNKLDLAEKYYLMAIGEWDYVAGRNLGDLYRVQNKLDLAEKYYIMTIEYYDSDHCITKSEHTEIIKLNKNLGSLYCNQNKFDLATTYYLKALLFDATIIKNIINIIRKVSNETQLEILELVPEIRTTDEYFNKLHREVYFRYTNKKVEMAQRLACHLNGDVIGICLEYY